MNDYRREIDGENCYCSFCFSTPCASASICAPPSVRLSACVPSSLSLSSFASLPVSVFVCFLHLSAPPPSLSLSLSLSSHSLSPHFFILVLSTSVQMLPIPFSRRGRAECPGLTTQRLRKSLTPCHN